MGISERHSLSAREAELRDKLLESPTERVWETPQDLSRMSIEALIQGDFPSRFQRSTGTIRLHGAGVHGHAAPLSSVGELALVFQRVIDALGASIRGHTASRGKLPMEITSKTALSLSASPGAGSIRLTVEPSIEIDDELGVQRPLEETVADQTLLVDQAVDRLFEVVQHANELSPLDDDFALQLREFGPRVARGVRQFAHAIAVAHFDADMSWAQPHLATKRVSTTATQMAGLATFIDTRELGKEERNISGSVHTVSAGGTALVLDDGRDLVRVQRGEITEDELRNLAVGDIVSVTVEVTLKEAPGGEMKESYRGLSVEKPD